MHGLTGPDPLDRSGEYFFLFIWSHLSKSYNCFRILCLTFVSIPPRPTLFEWSSWCRWKLTHLQFLAFSTVCWTKLLNKTSSHKMQVTRQCFNNYWTAFTYEALLLDEFLRGLFFEGSVWSARGARWVFHESAAGKETAEGGKEREHKTSRRETSD